tara:strand:+ start:224 stop:1048 length:825 start_codon:yes stop_codon:yes gene_type:complete
MNQVDVHGASILLVDDKQANLDLLEQSLSKAGYSHIQQTSDPAKVIELHLSGRCDLILLDMDFLGAGGLTLLKSLRKHIASPYLCVIVVTENLGFKLHSLQTGAKDALGKPYEMEELLARVHNALEARLSYRSLEANIGKLEQQFIERTSELQLSEARFRGFTDLVSDWYWEQDPTGSFTKVSGPVPEILGIAVDSTAESTNTLLGTGWNAQEQSILRGKISAREPFLDFEFTRNTPEGGQQTYLVSGQPMFDRTCNFLGYRGIGVEISAVKNH